MKNHQFLFGAVCYSHGLLGTPEREERFTRYFRSLFNYTMVPFHWANYEPRRGEYNEPYTGNLIDWADEIGVKKKLHALIWHEVCPDWLRDGEVEAEYTRRISHLMQTYGDRFDFFDLANETTVNDRFDNPVSRWIRQVGPMKMNEVRHGAGALLQAGRAADLRRLERPRRGVLQFPAADARERYRHRPDRPAKPYASG